MPIRTVSRNENSFSELNEKEGVEEEAVENSDEVLLQRSSTIGWRSSHSGSNVCSQR